MAADAYPHPLADFMCQGESKDLHSYFEQSVQNLLKESSEKFKGWLSTPGPLNTELSCKKVNATVWRGAWGHMGKHVQGDTSPAGTCQPANNPMAFISFGEKGSATRSLARGEAERWTALEWRVPCAQQSWQRAHRGVVSKAAGCLHSAPLQQLEQLPSHPLPSHPTESQDSRG